MSVRYRVHSAHPGTVKVPATTEDGHEIVGEMPAVLVELVPLDPYRSTITFAEICPGGGDALEKALAQFPVEGILEMGEWKLV